MTFFGLIIEIGNEYWRWDILTPRLRDSIL